MEKLKLNENHRRVVSVVLRGIEQMCVDIDHWLERQPGILFRSKDDLTPVQREALRSMTARLRSELRRLDREMELDHHSQSHRGAIIALLSSSIVNLEETDPAYLRGYGHLPEEARQKIEAEFAKLLALLEKAVGQFGPH